MEQKRSSRLAHEVNNPLAIVKGKIDVLRRLLHTDRFDRERFARELEKVEVAVMRLVKSIPGFENRVWNDLTSFPEGKGRALVIEDEADLAESLKFFLSEAGIESVICGTGAEALKVLGTEKVGIVLSDYRLPDMQGCDLLASAPDDGTPWVFVTAYPDVFKEIGSDARVRQVLRKPIDFRQIVEAAYMILTLAR